MVEKRCDECWRLRRALSHVSKLNQGLKHREIQETVRDALAEYSASVEKHPDRSSEDQAFLDDLESRTEYPVGDPK